MPTSATGYLILTFNLGRHSVRLLLAPLRGAFLQLLIDGLKCPLLLLTPAARYCGQDRLGQKLVLQYESFLHL